MADCLLDTGILIRYLRKIPGYDRLLGELQERADLLISAYTRIEIIRGMRDWERDKTLGLLDRMITVPLNNQNADLAGDLIRKLRDKGFALSDGDAIIAATALCFELELVTTNSKHFPLPDLIVCQADEQGNLIRRAVA